MDKPVEVIKILVAALVVAAVLGLIVLIMLGTAHAQTHTMPGSNVVPSGASLTISSGATITAAGGSTVTGFGGGAVSLTATAPIVVTPSPITGTGVISLTVGSTGGVEAWDTDLDVWATKTPYAGTVTVTTGKTFNATGNLTYAGTDGSTLNIGSGGTLGTAAYTASTAYQATLTNSAGLRGALSDENGTGAALFSGATTPDFTTGFTIGAAAASGKIPIGNGTNYVPSTPTFSNAPSTALKWMRSDGTNWITSTSLLSDTPSTALKWLRSDGTNWITSTSTISDTPSTSGKLLQSNGTNWTTSTPTWPTAAGTAGYLVRSDGTNFTSWPNQQTNASLTNLTVSTADIYLAGSSCVVAAGDFKAGGQYRCVFDMAKTAGTGSIVITLRIGTAGTTGDAAIQTFTFGAGTSVADLGVFDVVVNWRSVGSGTSAVVQGMCRVSHQLTTTGLISNAAGWFVLGSPSPSAGFASNTATTIGLSFNGSTAFAGTNTLVQSQLQQ